MLKTGKEPGILDADEEGGSVESRTNAGVVALDSRVVSPLPYNVSKNAPAEYNCASETSVAHSDVKLYSFTSLTNCGSVCWNSTSRESCVKPRCVLDPRMVWLYLYVRAVLI